MKVTKAKFFTKLTVLLVGMLCMIKIIAPVPISYPEAQRYSDDSSPNSIIMPLGEGESYNDNQNFTYDYKEITEIKFHMSNPSVGNTDPSMTNVCSPVSGTNIIQFYDRWYSNLIPNFEPGFMSGGKYKYYPNIGFPQIKSTIRSLYDLMRTNVGGGGTTYIGFKDGLTAYINNAGYSVNYSSFFSNTKTVNLSALSSAIDNNKVGVIFLSSYNFIYDITHSEDGKSTNMVKINSPIGHVMMVTGYQIVKYYKDGGNFRTDTLLYVCSAFADASEGYIKLNEYLSIDNALIINIL